MISTFIKILSYIQIFTATAFVASTIFFMISSTNTLDYHFSDAQSQNYTLKVAWVFYSSNEVNATKHHVAITDFGAAYVVLKVIEALAFMLSMGLFVVIGSFNILAMVKNDAKYFKFYMM